MHLHLMSIGHNFVVKLTPTNQTTFNQTQLMKEQIFNNAVNYNLPL